ncbi:LysR family transcriptional regulator [Holophaga foetida]|uniref:LysR family transcriptional regulator n=1 Tax=Holophaga foetida TaxID=35839 RepID=UPI0011DD6D39|nr:LysR family transcriptional regulator [Holophaga foetida]
MDIRHLRCFMTAAEHMNFTKAARQLFLTQSAVSYQISSLEKEVGVKLFERDPHLVRFTPAGERFHEGLQGLLKGYGELVAEIQGLPSGEAGSLVLGFHGIAEKRFLPPLLRRFRREHPKIAMELKRLDMVAMSKALQKGGVDIAFMLQLSMPDRPEIHHRLLFTVPLVVVLPKDHPLAQRESLTHGDLAGEGFLELNLPVNAPAHASFVETCARAGFRPRIAQRFSDLESLFLAIEMGAGIAIFPRYRAEVQIGEGHAMVEMRGEGSDAPFVVAWMADNDNPVLPVFLRAMGVRD